MTDPTPSMNRDEIARLKELEAKASGGTWRRSDAHGLCVANDFGVIADMAHDRVYTDPEKTRDNSALIAALRNAAPRLLALAEACRWRDVREEMPEIGKYVLCVGEHWDGPGICRWFCDEWEWEDDGTTLPAEMTPTHWMPLPLPPQGAERED